MDQTPLRTSPLHLTSELDGQLAVLRFDHGKANEMGSSCLNALDALCGHLARPDGPAALLTYSTKRSSRGTPIFVAGADVSERSEWSDDDVKAHVRWQRRLLGRLRRAPVFHIAVVSGVALGWGTEYLLTADWRIATDEAVFGLPETGLGIVPGAGGSSELWTEIGVGHALRLGMTGERIDAAEALRIGLVHERAASLDEGLDRARSMAAAAATRSPTANLAFKRAVLDSVGRGPFARAETEASAYVHCVDTGQAAVGRENFAAIRAGQRPDWGPRVPVVETVED